MPNMICRSRAALQLGGGRVGQEVEELVRLVRAGGDPQRLEREAGVAHPGVAVVPVAGAADRLGQRRRGRRPRSRRSAGRSGPAAPGRCGAPARATAPRSSGASPTSCASRRPCRRSRGVESRAPPRQRRRLASWCGAASAKADGSPARQTSRARGRAPLDRQRSGDDSSSTSAPPRRQHAAVTTVSSGWITRPYSGRGANSTSISTVALVQVERAQQRRGALAPSSCRGRCARAPARR